MKQPRLSVVRLMVVVVAVAINLTVIRILIAFTTMLLMAIALTGLALQAGGVALIQSRRRRRA